MRRVAQGERQALRVGGRRVREHRVVAGGERLAGPRLGVEPYQIRAPVLGRGHDHGAAVRGPDVRARPLAATGGRLVAQHGAAHVEVVIGREVLDPTVARHEQVGLIVRARRPRIDPAPERDRLSVRRERRAEDRTIDVHHRVEGAAASRDRIHVVVGWVVVRFGHAVRDEIDARTVAAPLRRVLVEGAGRHLMRLRRLVAGQDTRHRPDVGALAGVDIPFVVGPELGLGDDPDVALRLVLLVGLDEVFRRGRAREGDRLPVGRPGGGPGALRQVGKLLRLATGQRQEVELGVAVLGTQEGERRTVGRPAGRAVVRAAGDAPRRREPVGRDEPEAGLVPVVLRVHGDQHVRRPPPVGRDLRARHPAEREQVAIRNGALLRREPGRAHQPGERDNESGAHAISDLPARAPWGGDRRSAAP